MGLMADEKQHEMDDYRRQAWMRKVPCILSLVIVPLFWGFSVTQAAPPKTGEPQIQKLEINNQTHLAFRRYISTHPKGVILYLHGIQSHSGWYTQSCQMLAESGYTVYAPDRRGCGLNRQDRGHIQHYEDLIADIDAFLARIRADYPNLPVFLMGVSWGGKLALLYETMRPGQVNGLILSTPGVKAKVNLSLWDRMRVFYYSWRRREVQPEIPIPIESSSMFTDDQRWQNWIEQDPLTLRKATARFYWENNKMDKQIRRNARNAQAPILLLLAGRDEIIDNEKTIRFMGDKLPEAENDTLKIIEYPPGRHTLEFERYLRKVVADMVAWLNKQVSSRPAPPTQ